jgi:hypothetical protein
MNTLLLALLFALRIEAANRQCESFMLHETAGYYKGKPENSLVIEIVYAEDYMVEAVALRH